MTEPLSVNSIGRFEVITGIDTLLGVVLCQRVRAVGFERKVSPPRAIRGRFRSNQQLSIAIPVFFLRSRWQSVRGVLGQQLATNTIDLPRLRAANESLNAP